MPLTAYTRGELKQFHNTLTDRVLTPDDPVYVAQVNVTAGRADAVSQIANEIDFQDGGGVCLFTGQRGTGKSTELKRLERCLADQGCTVFYADLSEYILLTKQIEISDFLVTIAGAMSNKIEEQYHSSPGNRSYWERFRSFLNTRIELTEATAGWSGVEIKAALKNDPDFKERVQEASRGHIAQLVQEAHGFLIEAVSFVREKENDPDRKVVLILDSLERIRGVGNEAMSVYESVRNLFFAHAEHLRIPLLHVVYTVPPYLSILAAGAGSLMGGAPARRLVSTHIFKDKSRNPDPAGLEILRTVIDKRYAAWRNVLSEDALNQLALSSGGDLREFFLLIRLCCVAVFFKMQAAAQMRSAKEAGALSMSLEIESAQVRSRLC